MVRLYLSTPTALGISHTDTGTRPRPINVCLSPGISKHLAMLGAILQFKTNDVFFMLLNSVIDTKYLVRSTLGQFRGFSRVFLTVWDFCLKLSLRT